MLEWENGTGNVAGRRGARLFSHSVPLYMSVCVGMCASGSCVCAFGRWIRNQRGTYTTYARIDFMAEGEVVGLGLGRRSLLQPCGVVAKDNVTGKSYGDGEGGGCC